MADLGAILKKRIKEMKYTQADFADICGIGLSSLKKYMKNELPYSITHLEMFSELLDCSTDYLLGKSDTPKREIQTLKDLTNLSDNALLTLQINAADYTRNIETKYDMERRDNAEKDLIIISLILEDEELLGLIKKYFYFNDKDNYFNGQFSFIEVGGIDLRPSDAKAIFLTKIMSRLSVMEESFRRLKNKEDVLTKEVSENVKKCTRKWLDKKTE